MYFGLLKKPITLFGSSSQNSENKIETGLFVPQPYLRTNYIESKFEENCDMKNQFRIENLPHPNSVRETYSKIHVDNNFNNPSIKKQCSC